MKKKFYAVVFITLLNCILLCGFTIDPHSSVKLLTKPYITTYECTYARLGSENLLDKQEYIKITLIDDKNLELSYKKKNGKKHSQTCEYTYNDDTGEIEAEMYILGFKFKQATIIKNGKFTLSMNFLGKPLIMRFSA